jgi:hypothetical protein
VLPLALHQRGGDEGIRTLVSRETTGRPAIERHLQNGCGDGSRTHVVPAYEAGAWPLGYPASECSSGWAELLWLEGVREFDRTSYRLQSPNSR